MKTTLGQLVRSFFEDHLRVQKGLRPASIRSYRDVIRLYVSFLGRETRRALTRLVPEDLTFELTKRFLRHLEEDRSNHPRTRNHRLAALRTLFEYLASRIPEMLSVSQQVSAIPFKRSPPRITHYLDLEEARGLITNLPMRGSRARRDRTLLLFLWNTGARAQEVADLRCRHLHLESEPRVELRGKGEKWRACPLWPETARELSELMAESNFHGPDDPVFASARRPLTRFGIYKIVRRHAASLDREGPHPRRVSPHLFRHTAAVHLLESGVEVNVIRGWLGHASLESTNRYAEITLRTKAEALRACEASLALPGTHGGKGIWKEDREMLAWLNAL